MVIFLPKPDFLGGTGAGGVMPGGVGDTGFTGVCGTVTGGCGDAGVGTGVGTAGVPTGSTCGIFHSPDDCCGGVWFKDISSTRPLRTLTQLRSELLRASQYLA